MIAPLAATALVALLLLRHRFLAFSREVEPSVRRIARFYVRHGRLPIPLDEVHLWWLRHWTVQEDTNHAAD